MRFSAILTAVVYLSLVSDSLAETQTNPEVTFSFAVKPFPEHLKKAFSESDGRGLFCDFTGGYYSGQLYRVYCFSDKLGSYLSLKGHSKAKLTFQKSPSGLDRLLKIDGKAFSDFKDGRVLFYRISKEKAEQGAAANP